MGLTPAFSRPMLVVFEAKAKAGQVVFKDKDKATIFCPQIAIVVEDSPRGLYLRFKASIFKAKTYK